MASFNKLSIIFLFFVVNLSFYTLCEEKIQNMKLLGEEANDNNEIVDEHANCDINQKGRMELRKKHLFWRESKKQKHRREHRHHHKQQSKLFI